MENTVIVIVLVLFITAQFFMNAYDRKASKDREQDLMAALLAKNLSEYAAANAKLRTSTKAELKRLQEENKIAVEALKQLEEQGISVG